MAAAKRVLRYLCSTSGMGLVLGGRRPVVLTGHADASWADDQATQRSSQGYTFSLGSGSVSWRSTRSSSVLSSSCEAEIYVGAMAAQELRWLTYLLTDLGEQPRSPPVLYVDNKAVLALCREHRLEHRTKHIALRYFLARELQQRGQLRLAYVASEANTADIFTKALAPGDHQRFCTMLACFALLDWSCDLLFSPTLPMGDVTFDESVPYYRLFPYRTASLPPPPLFLAPGPPPVDPLPPQGPAPSGVSQVDAVEPVEVAVDSGAATGAEPAGAGSGGAGSGGAETEGAEPGGAETGGAEPGGAATGGTEPGGAKPGGAATGGTEPEGAEPGGAGSTREVSRGALSRREVLGLTPSPGPAPSFACPQPVPSQSLLQPVSPLPAPSPYTGPTGGLAERRAPASRPASPARSACTSRRTSRPRPPAVPGTHQMALRPSTAPQRVPLPSPPASSLPAFPDPESDSLRAASPTVARFLATVVTDPSREMRYRWAKR
ncbi:unnamed protein product [Closterium sp. NIES-53]